MLSENHTDYTIVLASGSPRRQQFLTDLEIPFELRLKEIGEVFPDDLKAAQITDYLAQLKASAFDGELKEKEILVTSDTIVWNRGKAVGKPKDYDDAVRMLEGLSGETHEVFTSVCLKTISETIVFHERTAVTFAPLSIQSIHFYLENFKPFDKAGAYGIQDWLGLTAISKIEGSYTNVVGLPTQQFYMHLNRLMK